MTQAAKTDPPPAPAPVDERAWSDAALLAAVRLALAAFAVGLLFTRQDSWQGRVGPFLTLFVGLGGFGGAAGLGALVESWARRRHLFDAAHLGLALIVCAGAFVALLGAGASAHHAAAVVDGRGPAQGIAAARDALLGGRMIVLAASCAVSFAAATFTRLQEWPVPAQALVILATNLVPSFLWFGVRGLCPGFALALLLPAWFGAADELVGWALGWWRSRSTR